MGHERTGTEHQPMDRKPLVQIRNLTKVFGTRTIVDNLTFEVARGEVFGFLGPNGAGKTTTIRMMVGLTPMTSGAVLIDGHDVATEYEKAIACVGAIVENPEMYKFMSGYKNLLHYARMADGVTRDRIDEVVRLLSLEAYIHDKVLTYSLGMRQRLGLAQALLHRPALLILDEPTNGLDPAGIRDLRDQLRRLADVEGIGVIVSSHALAEMELMCDRVAIIQDGRLVALQSLRSLMEQGDSRAERVMLRIDLDRPLDALDVLGRHFGYLPVTRSDRALQLEVEYELVPEINQRLVQAGIRIYGLRTVNNTLEDRFLELTGGGRRW